jgi:L-glutamine:2-deoxy-scyllo-inosose/3-amino-2,3-dideoxy-scyllo-inosose aminotransferase
MEVRKKLWPKWPEADDDTLAHIKDVVFSGRWAISGPYQREEPKERIFSRRFAEYNKINYCVTVDHATSALISALEALDVGFGDEVIVPGLTWVAPAIAVLSVNAVPVLVDIEPETFCMCPQAFQKAISSKTKAVIPIHMYGCMADMDEIIRIAKEHKLVVVEDAAHSHGSRWNGKNAGTFGDIGIFSFQQGKPLTCGEGGAALTDDPKLKKRLEESAWNSRTLLEPQQVRFGDMQLVGGERRFGTNRCLSEFQAAVLMDQLNKLDEQIKRREYNASLLDERLSGIPGIQAMKRYPQITRQSYYGYVVRIDERLFGCSALEAISGLKYILGMGDFLVHSPYPPVNQNPLLSPHPERHIRTGLYEGMLSQTNDDLKACREAYNTGIVFHQSVLLGDLEDIEDIVSAFQYIHENQGVNFT